MNSIADGSVSIQTSSQSVPSTPSWFGEAALIISYLRKQGVLSAIASQIRFARRRFGHYEVIDFLAVLFGYAISGERTLEEFYERLARLRRGFHGALRARPTAGSLDARALFGRAHPRAS